MLINTLITDKTIQSSALLSEVSELRCTRHPILKLRYRKNRSKGSWLVWHKKQWHKAGDWPLFNTKTVKGKLTDVVTQLEQNQQGRVCNERFISVGDLLDWYGARMADNANMSDQRKSDIASALNRHLMPKLCALALNEVNHSQIDKGLIWPIQKDLAKATVSKYFSILKAAFKDAYDLKIINNNPLAGMKITDFGDFQHKPKGSKLKPVHVAQLLADMEAQPVKVKVLCMVLLTLGNRIGETRKAKWHNIHLGANPEWTIPEGDTKTGKGHQIQLPNELAAMLSAYKAHQEQRRYKGEYVFPNQHESGLLSNEEAMRLIKSFSKGRWSSHDLRKCARICWAEQGADYMVGEKMLNHSLGKVAESYLDSKALSLRLTALQTHCDWLVSKGRQVFTINE